MSLSPYLGIIAVNVRLLSVACVVALFLGLVAEQILSGR